jgi:hypothetical protein
MGVAPVDGRVRAAIFRQHNRIRSDWVRGVRDPYSGPIMKFQVSKSFLVYVDGPQYEFSLTEVFRDLCSVSLDEWLEPGAT